MKVRAHARSPTMFEQEATENREFLRVLRVSAVETELRFTAEAQRSQRNVWLCNVQVMDEQLRNSGSREKAGFITFPLS